MAYTCPRCRDTFLFQPQDCPTCASQQVRKHKHARARERRASYDTTHRVSEAEFWQLLRLYPCCPCCGVAWEQTEGAIARDHIIPLSRGGPNRPANLQPLCQSCNLWKSDRTIYFERAIPGRPAAIPTILWSAFEQIEAYRPTAQVAEQLLLVPIADDPVYPNATPVELEDLTVQRTWAAIQASRGRSLESAAGQ
ncbi:HNH endonuclease [Synechococcus sp. PCC 7336]|uniref:HNH endonuclease n=1 Tax=Synechococcus sp. PCC 7336 TaxID=195250 RepID=UPI000382CF02|nr:HNH endonuclease signature motif containing protein [Synechococcus sp. PCC 7336]